MIVACRTRRRLRLHARFITARNSLREMPTQRDASIHHTLPRWPTVFPTPPCPITCRRNHAAPPHPARRPSFYSWPARRRWPAARSPRRLLSLAASADLVAARILRISMLGCGFDPRASEPEGVSGEPGGIDLEVVSVWSGGSKACAACIANVVRCLPYAAAAAMRFQVAAKAGWAAPVIAPALYLRRGSGIGIWKPSRCECAAARRMRASAGERGGRRLLCGDGARGERRGSGIGIWKPSR